jgi:cardiolipin synthase
MGSISRQRTPAPPPASWKTCRVFHDGDDFFTAIERAIDSALTRVDLEFYIFATDKTGQRIFEALCRARSRGVEVRVVVDGIGSSGFSRTYGQRADALGIQVKIFHEVPWAWWWQQRYEKSGRRPRWAKVFRRLNKRTHRKLCLIDSIVAYAGSFNVTDYHLASLLGSAAWRDSGVLLEGPDVAVLCATFDEVWMGRLRRLKRRFRRKRQLSSPLIRLNVTSKERREEYLDLLVRLVGAEKRIWITNAYFVPDGSLLRVLSVAAAAGVDVRILVPAFSDVVFIPWVTSAFHFGLLKAGVKIFEYRGSVLHAKTMLIDEWGLIGSSNLNHRSLLHDLEVDIVITDKEAVRSMEEQYVIDLGRSAEVTLENWRQRPLLERFLGRLLVWFRYVL